MKLEHKKSSYLLSFTFAANYILHQTNNANTPSQIPRRRLYLGRCWSSCDRMPKAKVFAQNNPRGESEMTKLPFFGWVIFLRGTCLFEPTRDIPSVLWRWHLHSLKPKSKRDPKLSFENKKQKSDPRSSWKRFWIHRKRPLWFTEHSSSEKTFPSQNQQFNN